MGLMLDALKQIEGRTSVPVILPLAENNTTFGQSPLAESIFGDDATTCIPAYDAVDVALPHIPNWMEDDNEPERHRAADGQPVLWPHSNEKKTLFHEKTAEAMLHQLSRAIGAEGQSAVVALTSPIDGDGKTGTIFGLAPELARRLRANVLVVDMNEGKPDLAAKVGLSTAGALRSKIYSTSAPGVHVLPGVPQSTTATWLNELRRSWPLIVLDTPSLAHATAGDVASFCDGIYLVVRLGHTPRRLVRQSARAISHAGGKLLGSIVVA